jgi:hypothetical protein
MTHFEAMQDKVNPGWRAYKAHRQAQAAEVAATIQADPRLRISAANRRAWARDQVADLCERQ